MGKGRAFFLLILLCVLGWIAYAYLLPAMDLDLFSPSGGPEKGIALFEEGNYAGAAKILEREVSQDKDTPEILLCLGRALKETGKDADAEKHLESLLAKYPSSPQLSEALFVLGEIASAPAGRAQRWLELLEKDYDGPWAGTAAMSLGDILADSGELFKARRAYSRVLLGKGLSDGEEKRIKNSLREMNKVLVFSPALTPDSIIYTVKARDTLNKIARDHNTATGLIRMSNKIKGDALFPGQELKVIKAPVRILVERKGFRLTVFLGKHWLKEYIVSIGAEQATPTGSFTVTNKLINPDWFRPGKQTIPYGDRRNILGTRWIGLSKKGYGIHGTATPGAIGQAVTKGCVRMVNNNVEEVFELVTVGTEVEIR